MYGLLLKFRSFLAYLRAQESGQDLLEYTLLLGLMGLILVASLNTAGSSVSTIFSHLASTIASASP